MVLLLRAPASLYIGADQGFYIPGFIRLPFKPGDNIAVGGFEKPNQNRCGFLFVILVLWSHFFFIKIIVQIAAPIVRTAQIIINALITLLTVCRKRGNFISQGGLRPLALSRSAL